jgi:hypothetical protein
MLSIPLIEARCYTLRILSVTLSAGANQRRGNTRFSESKD